MKRTQRTKQILAAAGVTAGLLGAMAVAPSPASAMPISGILNCLIAGGEVNNGGDAGWYCYLDDTFIIWL